MSQLGNLSRPSNPFSSRYIRPGAVGYVFAPGESAAGLVRRLAASAWRGQIVGPHGAGKSTLLAALDAPLRRAGRRVWSVALRNGARRMPLRWHREARSAGANLIVVDGYEQLGLAGRIALSARCRRRGWGLLVTAHRHVGLPTLLTIAPSVATTQAVVHRLVGHDSARVSPELVAACFADCGGNVRETLFALYDCWEDGDG